MLLLPHSVWKSTDSYLTFNSASLVYIVLFSLFSISCIVIATVTSRSPHPNRSCQTCHVCPISSSPAEELHAITQLINYHSTSPLTTVSAHTHIDIESPPRSQHSLESPTSLHPPKLDHQACSKVTLTFGSDKPEVYLKMARQAKNSSFLCRCPCKHQTPELASFPHISNASTVSTDLFLAHHMHTDHSLSSTASNKHPVTADKSATEWLVINQPQEEQTDQVVARSDITTAVAYTKMRTMVLLIDPAVIIHWLALKIIVSFHFLASVLYDRALDNSVVRIFQRSSSGVATDHQTD